MVDYCTPLPDLWPLFGVAIAVTLALVSFLFMLGRMILKSEFEAIARKELNQLIIAVVLSLCIVGLAGISCEATKLLVSDVMGTGNQFTSSTEYLRMMIYSKGLPELQALWTSSFMIKYFQISTSPHSTSFGDVKFKPTAVLAPLADMVEKLADALFAIVAGSLHAQLILIQLSEAFAMTVMLPVGMVLRAIPLTRKGGSFFMAAAFALYIVFPMTYVMDYSIFKQIEPSINELANRPHHPLETYAVSTSMVWVFEHLDKLAILLPQVTILAIINFTITVSFMNVFANFLDSIE